MRGPLVTRKIGNTTVSAIGLGTAYYGVTEPEEERFKLLDAAYEEGCTFWDTADVCGNSEDFIGKWFRRTGKRDEIFLATKFGPTYSRTTPIYFDPERYVKLAFEKSIKRLGVETIDLYYLHFTDENVAIERIVCAMAELVKDGKVKYLGLCEVSADTLRRAHAVHPIAALKAEYSPFMLDIEDDKIGLLKTCRELGVSVVAYSPLGRGIMKGKIRSPDDLNVVKDFRRPVPSEENIPNIRKLPDVLKAVGKNHSATAAQVALAWLLAQGKDIIPLPGTRRIKYIQENIGSTLVRLTPEEVKAVRQMADKANAANVNKQGITEDDY